MASSHAGWATTCGHPRRPPPFSLVLRPTPPQRHAPIILRVGRRRSGAEGVRRAEKGVQGRRSEAPEGAPAGKRGAPIGSWRPRKVSPCSLTPSAELRADLLLRTSGAQRTAFRSRPSGRIRGGLWAASASMKCFSRSWTSSNPHFASHVRAPFLGATTVVDLKIKIRLDEERGMILRPIHKQRIWTSISEGLTQAESYS